MFAASKSAAQAYAQVGVETGVAAASPHKLIVMLFDGAILAITNANLHMQRNEIAEKGRAISHAIEIITCGLKASLDKKRGGELAQNLDALYEYMCMRLLHANRHNDRQALDEVTRLLTDIKSAWEEIADDPAVRGANQVAA